ncbi:MAG: hypothetical protein DRN08_05760, partial [Thermoplasmata archaeon]
IKNAYSMFVKEHGFFAIFKPKYWSIVVSMMSVGLSNIGPMIITCLISGTLFAFYFSGLLGLAYMAYFLASLMCALINIPITIGNAILFAVNGLKQLLIGGFLYVINTIAYYFLGAIYAVFGFLNNIPLIGYAIPDDLKFKPILYTADVYPDKLMAYVEPDTYKIALALAKGNAFASIVSYTFVRPGAPVYLPTKFFQFKISFYEPLSGTKSTVRLPVIHPVAKTSNFICKYKPPPDKTKKIPLIPSDFTNFNYLGQGLIKKIEGIINAATNPFKSGINALANLLFGEKKPQSSTVETTIQVENETLEVKTLRPAINVPPYLRHLLPPQMRHAIGLIS